MKTENNIMEIRRSDSKVKEDDANTDIVLSITCQFYSLGKLFLESIKINAVFKYNAGVSVNNEKLVMNVASSTCAEHIYLYP